MGSWRRFLLKIMKITAELLEQYDIDEENRSFIKENYPNGIEFLELVGQRKLGLNQLHLYYKYFDLNEEEVKFYKNICSIDDESEKCWYSNNIEKSVMVSYSSEVKNSIRIKNSKKVSLSNWVSNSEEIYDCTEVFNSNCINNSTKIVDSFDVADSFNIQNCKHIGWSRNLINCSFVEESAFVYNSEKVKEIYFSGFLNNCNYCLFCSGLTDCNYYIFNVQVEQSVYEYWRELLLEQLNAELGNMIVVKEYTDEGNPVITTRRFDQIFDGLSDEFYKWVQTIPHFDENKFSIIFFKDFKK